MEGQAPGLYKEGVQSRKSRVQAKEARRSSQDRKTFRQNIQKSVDKKEAEEKTWSLKPF